MATWIEGRDRWIRGVVVRSGISDIHGMNAVGH